MYEQISVIRTFYLRIFYYFFPGNGGHFFPPSPCESLQWTQAAHAAPRPSHHPRGPDLHPGLGTEGASVGFPVFPSYAHLRDVHRKIILNFCFCQSFDIMRHSFYFLFFYLRLFTSPLLKHDPDEAHMFATPKAGSANSIFFPILLY